MTSRAVTRLATALSLASISASSVSAQEPPAGEGMVTISYQSAYAPVHLSSEGRPNPDLGKERGHVAVVDVQYGLTNRLSVTGAGVWMASKWTGDAEDVHGLLMDTGAFHYGLQDARVELRYSLVNGRRGVTPFVAVGVPMREYETQGHSAFGRYLKDFQVGTSAYTPARWGGTIHASIGYAFVEDVEGVDFNLDRISGDASIGYPVGSKLWLEAECSWQVMRDGLRVPIAPEHEPLREIHDRLVRSSFTLLGANATIPLNSRTDLTVGGYFTAVGHGIHSIRGVVTNLSWRFGGGLEVFDR